MNQSFCKEYEQNLQIITAARQSNGKVQLDINTLSKNNLLVSGNLDNISRSEIEQKLQNQVKLEIAASDSRTNLDESNSVRQGFLLFVLLIRIFRDQSEIR